jgi:hypothetical protein
MIQTTESIQKDYVQEYVKQHIFIVQLNEWFFCMGFQVSNAVTPKGTVFWVVTLCKSKRE